MTSAGECEKHKGSQQTQLCETCKTAFCLDCKAEHDPKHVVYHIQELGQKLILQLSKEDDSALYQEINKLSDDLNGEVAKIKNWFQTTEKKVIDVVHQCLNDVMSEVLEKTYEELNEEKKKMQDALKLTTEEREKIQDEIKTLIMDEKYADIFKYKDIYFQFLSRRNLFENAAAKKPIWAEHIKKVKNLTEDYLKDTLTSALKRMFSIPLTFVIPQKSNTVTLYNVASKKKTVHKMEGLLKSKHFDSVMIKNCIYIAGGLDEENKQKPVMNHTYEFMILETENKLTRKADMVKGRYAHKMVVMNEQAVYALGGIVATFYGTKYSNQCEKYDRCHDRWVELESLVESKAYINACSFNDRYIYVFGGFMDDDLTINSTTVEYLDTMFEKFGWKKVVFEDPNRRWIPFSQGAAVQLNNNMILLFGGRTSRTQCTADSFILDVKGNSMKLLDGKLAHPTSFYQRGVTLNKDEVSAIDATDNDLHIFNTGQLKWNLVKKAEWDIVEAK